MSRRPVRTDRPRRVAFDLLRAVDERDAYANLLMPTLLSEAGLVDRDAAFATELAYGSLRMQGQHDFVLAQVLDRPIADVDPALLTVLRLGVHQLHQMRVPTHAAVGESVELARAVVGESRASFVNAVLRRISSRPPEEWLADASREVRFSHAEWIVDAFSDALGTEDELEALLAADNQPAQVTLAVRDLHLRSDLLAAGATPGRHSPYALTWSGPLAIEGLGGPSVGVQDEGSQLVTLALTDVETSSDQRWLDLCAGPGGKAALLSAIAGQRDPGIRIVANEISAHRAELVRPQVGANTEVVVGDGREVDGRFDRILLDVPCSGLGALRRRPEARWRKIARDIAGLRPLQTALLEHALSRLNPGGVLAYVTCSPHIAETVQVVDRVIAGRTDLDIAPTPSVVADIEGTRRGRYVQLWPHRHGTDAMFMALIRRIGQ